MDKNTESELICETCTWMELPQKDAIRAPGNKNKFICRNDAKKLEIFGFASKNGELWVLGNKPCKLYEPTSE